METNEEPTEETTPCDQVIDLTRRKLQLTETDSVHIALRRLRGKNTSTLTTITSWQAAVIICERRLYAVGFGTTPSEAVLALLTNVYKTPGVSEPLPTVSNHDWLKPGCYARINDIHTVLHKCLVRVKRVQGSVAYCELLKDDGSPKDPPDFADFSADFLVPGGPAISDKRSTSFLSQEEIERAHGRLRHAESPDVFTSVARLASTRYGINQPSIRFSAATDSRAVWEVAIVDAREKPEVIQRVSASTLPDAFRELETCLKTAISAKKIELRKQLEELNGALGENDE